MIVLKKIYVILSYSGSNFAKFLKLFTKEKYVHTTISFDKDLNKAYSFGRKYVYTPLPGGFIQENFHKNCSYFKNSISKVLSVNEKHPSPSKYPRIKCLIRFSGIDGNFAVYVLSLSKYLFKSLYIC